MKTKNDIAVETMRKIVEDNKPKLVNFRLMPNEYEGLRILAELTGRTQTEIIRDLISSELEKQSEALEAYKQSIAAIKDKVKK